MTVYLYRPPQLGYGIRNYKFFNLKGDLLSFVATDAEVVINNAPDTIINKVDYLSGKIQNIKGEKAYLISYYEPGSFFDALNPLKFKQYFKFKQVSENEYKEVKNTKGASLNLGNQPTKKQVVLSRLLSISMILISFLLFYYLSFPNLGFDLESKEFYQLLALVIGISGLIGSIWNFEKYLSVNIRGFGLFGICVFLYYVLISKYELSFLFFIPIISIVLILFYNNYSKRLNFKV